MQRGYFGDDDSRRLEHAAANINPANIAVAMAARPGWTLLPGADAGLRGASLDITATSGGRAGLGIDRWPRVAPATKSVKPGFDFPLTLENSA